MCIAGGIFLPVSAFEPEAMNCTADNITYVKFLYKSNIDGINEALQLYKESHPGYDVKSLVDYMYSPFLNKASDSAKCLKDLGVDPSTVAQLSKDAQQIFNYDPERLSKVAPLFVQNVPVPEFPAASLVLLACIIFLALYQLKLRGRGQKGKDLPN